MIAVPVCDTWLLALAAAAPFTVHASPAELKHPETAGLKHDTSLTFLDDAVAFGHQKSLTTGTAEPSLDTPFWEGFWDLLSDDRFQAILVYFGVLD